MLDGFRNTTGLERDHLTGSKCHHTASGPGYDVHPRKSLPIVIGCEDPAFHASQPTVPFDLPGRAELGAYPFAFVDLTDSPSRDRTFLFPKFFSERHRLFTS